MGLFKQRGNNNMNKQIIWMALSLLTVTAFIGCRKDDDSALSKVVIASQTSTVRDTINDSIVDPSRVIHYTVNVVPAGNATGGNKVAGLAGAQVTCSVNGVLTTITTGSDGQATFPKLLRGNVTVTVQAQDFTTLNFVVDLNEGVPGADTLQRNASTMVGIFPTTGLGSATIKGRAFADLNQTVAGDEIVSGIKVTAVLTDGAQLRNFIQHIGPGNILSVMYENMVVTGMTDANGDYSLTVPASGRELEYTLIGDDFASDVVTAPGVTSYTAFSVPNQPVDVVSNVTRVVPLNY
ncbi:MAG: carboxypeptidase regulatory-like domain-containing protein [Sphingobacteriia bacterium]|nr:carboxypeptidase regulatory-like domain-containing protein [Sphingobacteriia bacterium]